MVNGDAIDRLSETEDEVLRTRFIVTVIVTMFFAVQIFFLVVNYSEILLWQFIGMIVSTNFAAVWLTIRGNKQIEDVRANAKMVYRPSILKFVHWLYELFEEMKNQGVEDPEEMISDIAPDLAAIIARYHKNKARINRMAKIEDDNIFNEAYEEFVKA